MIIEQKKKRINRAKKKVKQLEMENDILKQAALLLAKKVRSHYRK